MVHCLELNILVFLGAFAKLRKAITSFVMSVYLSLSLSLSVSLRPHGTTRLPLDGFS
jgi:hypothetical protein